MTEQEIREQIANLQAILNSGATMTIRDGHTVKFDHDSIRQQIKNLQVQLDDLCGTTRRHRLSYGINLNTRSCG